MPVFSYVVARFVPDMVKNEPVNVGIMVQDSQTGLVKSRFVKNFRTLAYRHPETDIWALEEIVGAFDRADGPESDGYLRRVHDHNKHNLRFTEPRAAESNRIADAVQTLYFRYVGIDRVRQRRAVTGTRLVSLIKKEIALAGFNAEHVKVRPRVRGKIGHFTFDYGFQNGKTGDLMHSVSFAGRASAAYRDAKALAVSFEDVAAANDGLECVAVMRPPESDRDRREFYAPAKGHLKDKKCLVVDERGIRTSLLRIRKKTESAK